MKSLNKFIWINVGGLASSALGILLGILGVFVIGTPFTYVGMVLCAAGLAAAVVSRVRRESFGLSEWWCRVVLTVSVFLFAVSCLLVGAGIAVDYIASRQIDPSPAA